MRSKNSKAINLDEHAHMKAVPGFQYTWVSADGEVFSCHPKNRARGAMTRLAPADNGRGYLRIRCEGRMMSVHKLIALAFLGPLSDGFEVNHKDGNKRNNRPNNLEYTSRSGNMRHAKDMGLRRDHRGESHHLARLSNDEANRLRDEYAALIVQGKAPRGAVAALAARFGVRRDYPRDLYMGRVRRDY